MENGKVKEAILNRSIYKAITYKRPEMVAYAGIGNDAAVMRSGNNEVTVISTNPVTYTFNGMEKLAVVSAVNNVAAMRAEPIAIQPCILLPQRFKETALKKIMQNMNIMCRAINVQITGGHTEVTPAVASPVITVNAVGRAETERIFSRKSVTPGMDIVMSKYIGIAGTVIMLDIKREQLEKRFCKSFLDGMSDFEEYYPVLSEAAVAVHSGVAAMHDISHGGIMGALWEIASAADVGLEIILDNIPIRQETVELCELFNLNPYEMLSTGALLMITDNGSTLVSELSHRGVESAVIGRTTDRNDRIFLRNGEWGFITPPRGDEIYKLFQKGEQVLK